MTIEFDTSNMRYDVSILHHFVYDVMIKECYLTLF